MRWSLSAGRLAGLGLFVGLVVAVVAWSLRDDSGRGRDAGAPEWRAGTGSDAASPDLELAVPDDAGAPARGAARRAPEPGSERASAAGGGASLRIVCSATDKAVPAFEVEFEHAHRTVRATSDLEGRVSIPAGFAEPGAGVRSSSELWGYRKAALSIEGHGVGEGGFIRPAGGPAGVTLRYRGASFMLVELPGLALDGVDPIYGDFRTRHALGPELLLALDSRRDPTAESANAVADFELRGRGRRWVARGSLEWVQGSIQTERVRLEPQGQTRLELVLLDERGRPLQGGHMGRIRVTHAGTGEVSEHAFGGERAIFPGLPPGGAVVSGMAEGLSFSARGIELRPFEELRLELRGEVLSRTGVRLDLVLQVHTDRDVEQEQLPARVHLKPGLEEPADATAAEESVAARVEWSGAGSSWRGEAVFGELPRGAYRLALAAPSPWAKAGGFGPFDSPVSGALEAQLEPRSRSEELWVQHDELVVRELSLRVPRVLQLTLLGQADPPCFEEAAGRVGVHLSGKQSVLRRVGPGQPGPGTFSVRRAARLGPNLEGYMGTFIEEQPRTSNWEGGRFELDLFAEPGENFVVTYEPLGAPEESRPGFVAMDFAVELAPARSLDRSVLQQGYLGE